MSDHDDLLAQAERNARRLRGLADAIAEDAQARNPDVPMDGLPRIERDAAQSLDDLAAALRAVTAERDALRQIVRTLDALVPQVTRPDIWPAEQADVIRRALEQETPDGE